MAKKSQKQNAAKAIQQKKGKSSGSSSRGQQLVRAPQNISVRGTTPRSNKIHTEIILEVKKGAQQFVLHPDNIPWLRQVAPSFQRWRLTNLKMWYEPRVSTTTNGTISLAFLSDFEDDTQSILQGIPSVTRVGGSCRGSPWDKFNLTVPGGRTCQYVNISKFSGMSGTDKNARALGTLVAYADMDPSFPDDSVVGRVFLQFVPILTEPTDPASQALK